MLRIEPKEKDLGELTVRRVLPSARRQMVGPFIFFDHMGPAEFPPGKGINVRPHPHIGLATITYLFEGEIIHRDNLGFVQPIHAGAVNLMTAGRGIVHSERAGDDLGEHSSLHGIQSWMALPEELSETDPGFFHYPAKDLPEFDIDGATIRLIMGEAYGRQSPVKIYSPMVYLECRVPKGCTLTLPDGHEEIGAYVVSGEIASRGETYAAGVLAIDETREEFRLEALEDSRIMIIGGTPLGKRYIWWNFVSHSKERMEQAKRDWREGRFGKVPGDDEFIPLPPDPAAN
jgi:redox-sensitive bicupin YhaK (pirin superfamily)